MTMDIWPCSVIFTQSLPFLYHTFIFHGYRRIKKGFPRRGLSIDGYKSIKPAGLMPKGGMKMIRNRSEISKGSFQSTREKEGLSKRTFLKGLAFTCLGVGPF